MSLVAKGPSDLLRGVDRTTRLGERSSDCNDTPSGEC